VLPAVTVRLLEIAEIELDQAILVLTVAHLHRRPDYWRDRLPR
jgi:hypothetical protein